MDECKPLLVGLTVECGLDIGTTLIFTGLYNVATAFMFDIPMPLQPMKTIAAVAISDPAMNVAQIVSGGGDATTPPKTFSRLIILLLRVQLTPGCMRKPPLNGGMFVSVVVLFLGATGLIDTFNRITPRAVIHGRACFSKAVAFYEYFNSGVPRPCFRGCPPSPRRHQTRFESSFPELASQDTTSSGPAEGFWDTTVLGCHITRWRPPALPAWPP